MNIFQSPYLRWREAVAPVLKESKFKEHGKITPEEFVVAGDFLTYKFPVWSWAKGDAKPREHLPADKQYLITKGVPCLRRASDLAYTDEDIEKLVSFDKDSGGGDEWVQTHANRTTTEAQKHEIADIPDDEHLAKEMGDLNVNDKQPAEIPDMDDIPDMEEEDLEGDAPQVVAPTQAQPEVASGSGANILQVRKYDVMITYDKLYQTPRVWLVGFDPNGQALKPQQVFQDISADHANKTVTIEPFPHSNSLTAASVHPCKHASVMKKVIERMNAGYEESKKAQSSSSSSGKRWIPGALRKVTGTSSSSADKVTSPTGDEDDGEGMKVDYYLVVFLKFMASIVPTIEVDSTTAF